MCGELLRGELLSEVTRRRSLRSSVPHAGVHVQEVAEWPLCSNVTLALVRSCLLNYNLCDTQIEPHTYMLHTKSYSWYLSAPLVKYHSVSFISVTIVYVFHMGLALLLQLQLVNGASVDSLQTSRNCVGWLCVCVYHMEESHSLQETLSNARCQKHDTYSLCTGSSLSSLSVSLFAVICPHSPTHFYVFYGLCVVCVCVSVCVFV